MNIENLHKGFHSLVKVFLNLNWNLAFWKLFISDWPVLNVRQSIEKSQKVWELPSNGETTTQIYKRILLWSFESLFAFLPKEKKKGKNTFGPAHLPQGEACSWFYSSTFSAKVWRLFRVSSHFFLRHFLLDFWLFIPAIQALLLFLVFKRRVALLP